MIDNLALGEAYTRADVDRLLGTTSVAKSREGIVYLPDRNIALLFVTLDKTGRGTELIYNDWFEDDFFHWDSQNQQHFDTPRMRDMVSGRLRPHLMVRIRERDGGATQPFIFAGELAYSSHESATRNPVHIVWESTDYTEKPSPRLRDIYEWRPATAGRSSSRPSVAGRVSRRRVAGQGYNQNPLERLLIEARAMAVAGAWYESVGYSVEVTAATKSWDLECSRAGEGPRRVEVKGTVGGPGTVFLTANEVKAAQTDGVPTDLFIVHSIEMFRAEASELIARGGQPCRIPLWIPQNENLMPTEYRYSVPDHLLEHVE